MKNDINSLGKELRKLVSGRGPAKWIVHPDRLRAKYLPSVLAENWTKLDRMCLKEITARDRQIEQIFGYQKKLTSVLAMNERVKPLLSTVTLPSKRANWDLERDAIKSSVIAAGLTENSVDSQMKTLDKLTSSTPFDIFEKTLSRLKDTSNSVVVDQISRRMISLFAISVCRFNINAAKSDPTNKQITPFIKKTSSKLSDYEKTLQNAISQKRLDDAIIIARNYYLFAEKILLADGPLLAAKASINRMDADTRANGVSAVSVADVLRDLLRASTYGRLACWVLGWGEDETLVHKWIKMAGLAPSAVDGAPSLKIAALLDKPLNFENKPICLTGKVGAVEIRHLGRKAISSTTIQDARGKSVAVVLPYIKLDSGGMVEGSFASITGIWANDSKETSGAALMLQRRNLAEENSWQAFIDGQLSGIFRKNPHELKANWSWEIGLNGASNPLRYGTWRSASAGEL